MFLAMDAREPDMCRVAGRLCRALTDGDARSLGVLTRSFPPGLLAPSPPDQVRTSCFVLLTLIHDFDAEVVLSVFTLVNLFTSFASVCCCTWSFLLQVIDW